jgi:S-adenosylmethionine decarboxylase
VLEFRPSMQTGQTGGLASGTAGTEWLVDAFGCRPDRLRSVDCFATLFNRIVRDLGLHPLGEPIWHVFPGEGGLTGLLLLRESHLACHTFPEDGFAAVNLYCCRARRRWAWQEHLADLLGAEQVIVRGLARGDPSPTAWPVSPESALPPSLRRTDA